MVCLYDRPLLLANRDKVDTVVEITTGFTLLLSNVVIVECKEKNCLWRHTRSNGG